MRGLLCRAAARRDYGLLRITQRLVVGAGHARDRLCFRAHKVADAVRSYSTNGALGSLSGPGSG
jgi:hypothetical protein